MISLFLFACFSWALAADQETSELVQRIRAKDSEVRREAKEEIIAGRKRTISALLDVVEDSSTNDHHSVALAIFCLGEMRAVESINVLVEKIVFPYGGQGWGHPKFGGYSAGVEARSVREWYVAVDALLKIGEPCIPSIINRLSMANTRRENDACKALLLLLRSASEVEAMISKAILEEPDPQKQNNLRKFLGESKE
jgi:hypothetical protein